MTDMWHITSQSLQTELNTTGVGFVPVWRVGYQVDQGPAKGTQGHINVPADQHNAETVKAAIDAAVYNIDKVASL